MQSFYTASMNPFQTKQPTLKVLIDKHDESGQHHGLVSWMNDGGPQLNSSTQSLIYALMKKYRVARPYVTVEGAYGPVWKFLLKHYEKNIAMATYEDYTSYHSQDDKKESLEKGVAPGTPQYSSLVIRADGLDAFYFKLNDSNLRDKLIIFFSDPKVFDPLKEKNPEIIYSYPFGNYSLEQGMFGFYLMPLSVSKTDKPILPSGILESLSYDTNTFFENAAFYRGHNPIGERMPHKRGILLIGPPGNGKSTAIKAYLSGMKNKYGILIDCSRYLDNSTFQWLEKTLGDRQKVVVFEDCDSVCQNYSSRSAFLNFIDGVNNLENTLVIGTTNFPNRLDDAILDRPSRFDSIYYLGRPDVELRKQFLAKWFPYLMGDAKRMHSISVATDGYSGAAFKELFIMTGLRKCSVEDALQSMQLRRDTLRKVKSGELETSQEPMPQHSNPMQGSIQASLQIGGFQLLSRKEFLGYKKLRADKLTRVYREARKSVEEDPKFSNYHKDPKQAEQLGKIQQALQDCRSEEEISSVWQKFKPSAPLETVLNS